MPVLRLSLLLVVLVACTLVLSAADKADRFGDPLPKGAIARLGSSRLRHPQRTFCVAFSPDGKTAEKRLVERLIQQLDDADFATRRQALAELAALGRPVASHLRQAAESTRSAGIRLRCRTLLQNCRSPIVNDPRTLQRLRAVRSLRLIGSPSAKKLLEELGKGIPEGRQTIEAHKSMTILNDRHCPE